MQGLSPLTFWLSSFGLANGTMSFPHGTTQKKHSPGRQRHTSRLGKRNKRKPPPILTHTLVETAVFLSFWAKHCRNLDNQCKGYHD